MLPSSKRILDALLTFRKLWAGPQAFNSLNNINIFKESIELFQRRRRQSAAH